MINTLRFFGAHEEICESIDYLASIYPESFWDIALEMGSRYCGENNEYTWEVVSDALCPINFNVLKMVSLLFPNLTFFLNSQGISNGLPV